MYETLKSIHTISEVLRPIENLMEYEYWLLKDYVKKIFFFIAHLSWYISFSLDTFF